MLARVPATAPMSVSVSSRCSLEMAGRIELVLAWRLLSISPTLSYKEIQVSVKNKRTAASARLSQ